MTGSFIFSLFLILFKDFVEDRFTCATQLTIIVAIVANTIFGCNVKNFLKKSLGYVQYYNKWPS